jgi:serine/threonine protein kinase
MHGLQLIHTDLKPENILLVSSDHAQLPENKVYIYYGLCSTDEIYLLLEIAYKFHDVHIARF